MVVNDPSDSQQGGCFEGQGLVAYKNKFHGVYYAKSVRKVIFRKNIIIDNGLGIGAQIGTNGGLVEINDNKIYGDSISPDCPRGGGFCHRMSKCAYTSSVFVMTTRQLHP